MLGACLEPPCSSEGTDTSITGWATDIMTAVFTFVFAITLLIKGRPYTSVFNQFGQTIAYICGALGHSVFSNRASDGCGMLGFYVVWLIAFIAGGGIEYGLDVLLLVDIIQHKFNERLWQSGFLLSRNDPGCNLHNYSINWQHLVHGRH